MDPVTHAVSGMALAVSLPGAKFGWREPKSGLILALAAVAGIAPDIDHWDTFKNDIDPGLGYLLYHRGVTHTLVGCALLALILLAPIALFARKGLSLSRVFVVAFGAGLLHVVMDGTNDYGVRPFWPVNDGWVYGDFIFLVEPLVVTTLLPLAWSGVLQDWGSRRVNLALLAFGGLLALLAVGLAWYRLLIDKEWATWSSASLSTVWFVAQLAAALHFEGRRRAQVAWASLGAVFLTFFVCSRSAKSDAEAAFQRLAPTETLKTVDVAPAPSNPFCWRVTLGSRDAQGDIVARTAVLSLRPRFMVAKDCVAPTGKTRPTLPGVEEAKEYSNDALKWLRTIHTSWTDFDRAARQHPRVAAAARFLRTPVLVAHNGRRIVGDLRVDYENDLAKYSKYQLPQEPDTSSFRSIPWHPPFFDERDVQAWEASNRHAAAP
jgi:inner membrane protein